MNEKISVIICTKNRMQEVTKCIESVLTQTLLPDEIVIIDGSDTEALNLEIKRRFNVEKIVYIHSKPGYTYQQNIGIEASSGDIIIFLDDDVILDKDYIKNIIYVFDNDFGKKVGGVSGEIIAETQDDNLVKRIFKFGFQILITMFFLSRYGDGKFQLSGLPKVIKSGSVDKITNIEYLHGCDMAFRREVISEFRFGDDLPGYIGGADDDISYRISRKYQNIYTPFAKLFLQDVPSTIGSKYALMKKTIENHYYLFKKNLPQDFKHKFAFWWSVVGLFVREGIPMVVRGDSSGVHGLVSGMREVLKRRRNV